mmetsp:Transcript_9952/g.23010  ORF Transcript_9952/g.23010 Transcript_9952/m.23010 type:complete len:91 (-) Transcript_9952:352-624(-)
MRLVSVRQTSSTVGSRNRLFARGVPVAEAGVSDDSDSDLYDRWPCTSELSEVTEGGLVRGASETGAKKGSDGAESSETMPAELIVATTKV